jgi:copper transporter 1
MGGMSGMGGMGGMGDSCKINMLWNWYTIDACFLTSSWHITSRGMFAGSCIGVICLVLLLEFLRRSVKEYDRFLVRQHIARFQECSSSSSASPSGTSASAAAGATTCCTRGGAGAGSGGDNSSLEAAKNSDGPTKVVVVAVPPCAPIPPFRPNVFQQAVRALLHMFQFAIAYFVML